MLDEAKTGKLIKVNGRDAWLIDGVVVPRFCGGAPDPKDPPADPPEPKKVDMTQEQLDTLINKQYAEAHTKAEAKAQTEIDALKKTVGELKAAGTKDNKDDKVDKGGNKEDVTALTDRIAVMEQQAKDNKAKNSRASLLAIASDLNAVSAEQVAILIGSNIKTADDGTLSVINAEGQERMSAEGKPMTAKELIAEFLKANPNHVKASGKQGAGSQGAMLGGEDNAAILKLKPVERLKLARKQGAKN